ncbi:hypothetical protein ACLGI4_09750 [Streptomyces sp. HMX112]|uniref:hypothetical protein n=1 Tax=Streptomyces sp. HMX112 TaxID=3390850 RepID=UPI003A803653
MLSITGTQAAQPSPTSRSRREEGEWRRVRFGHFVATVRVQDLRPVSPAETEEIQYRLQQKQRRYGGQR